MDFEIKYLLQRWIITWALFDHVFTLSEIFEVGGSLPYCLHCANEDHLDKNL